MRLQKEKKRVKQVVGVLYVSTHQIWVSRQDIAEISVFVANLLFFIHYYNNLSSFFLRFSFHKRTLTN